MTSTVQRYTPPANGGRAAISQATAVEQSRAIADVQAAVTVAQNCPRDMQDAEREMEYVCGRLDMAEQAFYAVTNRGTGPSVHLMRELARIWGNVDYGVKELARNDDKGESEVLATCWDMQKNTRSSRTFIVPHQRMRGGARVDLTDLGDIYLNNQNTGARAVRECIATILPRWFTEKAQAVCRATLEHGEGEPIQDRIALMVDWFRDSFGVSERQLEGRIGKKRGAWTPEDVAQMKIAGKSIKAGEITVDEVFPPADAETVEDLACEQDAAAPATSKLAGKVKSAAPPPADDDTAEVDLTTATIITGGKVDDSEPDTSENCPEPETQQVSEPAQVDESDQSAPDTEATLIAEKETGSGDGDTNEVETQVENTTADPAPGAPTESTPGQTDRVNQALDNARKMSGARVALLDLLAACFRDAGYKMPENLATVASSILKIRIKDADALTDSQLKTVHNSLNAWRTVGTLTDMVTGIVEAADMAAEEQQQDGEQQTLGEN